MDCDTQLAAGCNMLFTSTFFGGRFLPVKYVMHTDLQRVSKKVPTLKLSVTLSNLNRFSKVLHCWKACEICYKTHMTIPTLP